MTNELEKQFFDIFEIKPKELIAKTMNCACGCHDCKNCDKYKNALQKTYPQITDHILLELICILCKRDYDYNLGIPDNIEELKNYLLKDCIKYISDIKHKVRALFGGNND